MSISGYGNLVKISNRIMREDLKRSKYIAVERIFSLIIVEQLILRSTLHGLRAQNLGNAAFQRLECMAKVLNFVQILSIK